MRLRYNITAFFLGMCIMACTGCQKKVQEEPKVVFQDPVFQKSFDDQRYFGVLPTQSQLNQMTSLVLFFSRGEECNLVDLEKFPNLRGLYIRNASQSVIRQVSEQEQLKALGIIVHDPVDMSPIGAMHNVKALEISAPDEEAGKFDWSFIGDMKQLEALRS